MGLGLEGRKGEPGYPGPPGPPGAPGLKPGEQIRPNTTIVGPPGMKGAKGEKVCSLTTNTTTSPDADTYYHPSSIHVSNDYTAVIVTVAALLLSLLIMICLCFCVCAMQN